VVITNLEWPLQWTTCDGVETVTLTLKSEGTLSHTQPSKKCAPGYTGTHSGDLALKQGKPVQSDSTVTEKNKNYLEWCKERQAGLEASTDPEIQRQLADADALSSKPATEFMGIPVSEGTLEDMLIEIAGYADERGEKLTIQPTKVMFKPGVRPSPDHSFGWYPMRCIEWWVGYEAVRDCCGDCILEGYTCPVCAEEAQRTADAASRASKNRTTLTLKNREEEADNSRKWASVVRLMGY